MPSRVKKWGGETKVKRKWDIQSENEIAATSNASQSPLTCSLAIIIQVQFPIMKSVMGQWGTSPPRYCCNSWGVLYVTKLIGKQPTAGTLSWRFFHLSSGEILRQIWCHGFPSLGWWLRVLAPTSLLAGPLGVLSGSSWLWATQGLLSSWNELWDVGPCCARMCMNCSCCEIKVCSKTLASASTRTVNFECSSLQIEGFYCLVRWWVPPVVLYAAWGYKPRRYSDGFLGVSWHRPRAKGDLWSHSC